MHLWVNTLRRVRLAMLAAGLLIFFVAISGAQDTTPQANPPSSCPRGDNVNTFGYYDAVNHYCLIIPIGYTTETTAAAALRIITDNPDAPNQTQLDLTITPATGQSLADIQTALAQEFADSEIEFADGQIAGVPALFANQIPGEPPAFQAFWLREENLFTLTLTPYDENLWRTIAISFHFPPPQTESAIPDAPPAPDECPAPSETHQLVYQSAGYFCFLYPTDFVATAGTDSGGVFIVPVAPAADTASPTLGISVNVAPDVTLDDIEDSLREQLPEVDIEFARITLSGVEALVTDNLPGNIGNRQAFLLANNLLYIFTLTPVDAMFVPASEQAEALWTLMLESFTLITPPVTPERPIIQTLFNARFGYSLIYPAGFQISEQPDGSVELTEQATTPDKPQARFSIFVLPAQGRTLAEIQQEIEAQNVGLELQFAMTTIGGEPAIMTDKLPGLAISRQALFIREDRLFILVLIPFDETLWQTFTDDFEFIDVAQGSPIQVSLDDVGAAFLLPENWRLTQFGTTYYINAPTGSIPWLTLRRDDTLPGGADKVAFAIQVENRLLPETVLEGVTIGMDAVPTLRAIPAAREQICQVLYVPQDTFGLVLTVNRPACDSEGVITSPEVLRLLESLAIYPPIE